MKQKKNPIKFVIIIIFAFSWLVIPPKNSLAVNSVVIGFIIEASRMEGTIQGLELVTGETINETDRPMLEMNFVNLKAEGLKIKKLVQIGGSTLTTNIGSEGNVQFKSLKVKVTNATFDNDTYKPENGNIGLKNVKLLAHSITTGEAALPQFQLTFNQGGNVELEPKSEQELKEMEALLKNLLKPNENGKDPDSQTGNGANKPGENADNPQTPTNGAEDGNPQTGNDTGGKADNSDNPQAATDGNGAEKPPAGNDQSSVSPDNTEAAPSFEEGKANVEVQDNASQSEQP